MAIVKRMEIVEEGGKVGLGLVDIASKRLCDGVSVNFL